MIQSNVAPEYKKTPKYHHNNQNELGLEQVKNERLHHLKGEHKRLFLNKVEKDVLVVGIVLVIGLMLILVSTRVTNDYYQHQIVSVNANISKYHNLNNNSRQRVSDLQSNGRLQKIAHRSHLKFSSHGVRNVK